MDYKKYSLEQLENWMHDAMSAGEATPQEIYDTILGVVKENYYTYKDQVSKAYELLVFLNGNGQSLEDVIREKQYYEPSMPPLGNNDKQYLSAKTKNGVTDTEYIQAKIQANSAYNDGWTREYYQEIVDKYEGEKVFIKSTPLPDYDTFNGCDESPESRYKMSIQGSGENGDGFMVEDKVVKWVLSVEVDGLTGDCFVTLPDDLLERAGLVEGDNVKWIDNGDGSFTMRKVTQPLKMDEC